MKKISFVMLFITICVMLNAESGEELLKRAISTNPTNRWGDDKQKGQWTKDGYNISAYLFSDGRMYFGNWFGNKLHGYGLSIMREGWEHSNCRNARYYVGNFSSNEKSGKGTCYDASGTLIYYGDFKNDKPTGTYPTTDSYTSYKFQTINYSNGVKYIGETKDGKKHGYGVLVWEDDGEIWIGHWKDDVRAGEGLAIKPNGSLITGYWENNTRRDTATAVASESPRSSSSSSSSSSSNFNQNQNPDGTVTTRMPGYESTYNPNTGYGTVTSTCPICAGTGRIQALNPMYGIASANAIRGGYVNTTPMYTLQVCYMCNGLGKTTTNTYVDPNPSYSSNSGGNSSSSSSSGRTRTCDLCLGKGQLWEYTGSVGDNRTTIYCSVSGCDVKSPHRHTSCHRCNGTGKLNL